MDRHADRGPSWFDEVLRESGTDPGRLARADSPKRPVVERNNPWNDPDGIEDAAAILDAALGKDKDPGRIVFVTDVDEDPIARVQAAVQIGRAAVARGLDVLLVDADVRHVGLSRWLPDRDLDAEGLVDVLQYGASVSAARRPSAVDGIDVLGVGSYRPDVAAIYGEEDLRRLLAQLRLSAGLVIIVGPVRLLDQRFHPMLAFADSAVLSMHLDQGLSQGLREFLGHLADAHIPLSGAFVWSGPDDSEKFVDNALLERSRVLPPMNVGSPFPGRGRVGLGAVDGESDPAEPVMPAPVADATPPRPEPELESGPATVSMKTERPRPGRTRNSGSSGLVRGVFVVVAIGILGFVGWWALTWRSVEPTRPRVQPPQQQAAVTTVAEPVQDLQTAAAVDDETAELVQEEELAAAKPGAEDVTGGEEAVETSRDVEGLLAEPLETAPDAVEEITPEPEVDPFEAALRREGGVGWGLHLSSFTSADEAEADRARLERQGYSAVVREATVKGDRWYRVLVGHFPTKAEAAGYRNQAQEKFHVDWVGVVEK